jgi:hypothetical protein
LAFKIPGSAGASPAVSRASRDTCLEEKRRSVAKRQSVNFA